MAALALTCVPARTRPGFGLPLCLAVHPVLSGGSAVNSVGVLLPLSFLLIVGASHDRWLPGTPQPAALGTPCAKGRSLPSGWPLEDVALPFAWMLGAGEGPALCVSLCGEDVPGSKKQKGTSVGSDPATGSTNAACKRSTDGAFIPRPLVAI